MSCTRNRTRTLAPLLALLALFAILVAPQMAFAGEGALTVGSASTTVTLPEDADDDAAASDEGKAMHVKYIAKTGGKGTWKYDGKASSVAKSEVESFRIVTEGSVSGSVQYRVYVQGYGWQKLKANGGIAGTTAAGAKRVEAVQIALTGKLSKSYDVSYQVKLSSGKWSKWKKNGRVAGRIGTGLKAIRVKLVRKAKAGSAATGLVGMRYHVKLSGAKWQKWLTDNELAGATGTIRRIQGMAVALDAGAFGGDVLYRVRLSNGTWKPWAKNGKVVGPYVSVEALQIKLAGKIAEDYDVVYRTYVRGIGWQARVRNGQTAGTARGRRIEALRIELVPKSERDGWVKSGSFWRYYEKGVAVKGRWVKTAESPINVMTAKTKSYWLDAKGHLAVSRIIDPSIARDKGVKHACYATKWGYLLKSAKLKTSKGFALVNDRGVILNKKGWLETDEYDGDWQRYYMKSVGSFSVARTGFFKVGKSRYYGFKKKGYIMRGTIMKIGKYWYTAKDSGALGKATSTQRLIERYVRWAVDIANDDSHGYTQDLAGRWGPDYDCSSLVISAVHSTGLDVGEAVYTGNMKSELTAHGFRWHTDLSKIRRGDILLVHNSNRQHTEIYLGKGKTVGAHIAETGGIYGVTGDQTGEEIDVGPYYAIWEGFLRLGS